MGYTRREDIIEPEIILGDKYFVNLEMFGYESLGRNGTVLVTRVRDDGDFYVKVLDGLETYIETDDVLGFPVGKGSDFHLSMLPIGDEPELAPVEMSFEHFLDGEIIQ